MPLWGWATPGRVTLTKATGVSKVDQAQFSREPQDTVRVLSGLYTPFGTVRKATAPAYFFSKARVPASVMAPKKGCLGKQEATQYGLKWTHMETYIEIMNKV